MANPSRKMATMRKVDAITPIEGADRIECAHIGGWTCVVGKGDFQPGDLCVYYEVDSFLPTSDPRYAQFAERGEKVMTMKGNPTRGHALRTVKLRGQISQGLVMRPQDVLPESVPEHAYQLMYERKARLDGICGVCEYHPDQDSLTAGFIGKYDPFVAPRTNAERIQNIDQETWDLMRRTDHYVSVKVDGRSTTLVFDARTNEFKAFSHNNRYDLNAGLGATTKRVADEQGLTSWCEDHPGISLGCELCGPKIQSDRLGLGRHRLFVFSVWDMEERRYLNPCDHPELLPHCVPMLEGVTLEQFGRPEEFLSWTDGIRSNVTKGRLDEGVVAHAVGKGGLSDSEWLRLKSAIGETVQIKAVSNKYLLKG